MLLRPALVVPVAALAPVCALLALLSTPAQAQTGLTYSWVGSRSDPNADDHSWTDRRNWSPKGVPGDGDAVNIVSPQSGPCDIHVDQVPNGLTLNNFLLSTSIMPGCHASIRGGSIAINGTFEWTGGTVDTPMTVLDGSGVHIGDEPVPVIERLRQSFVMPTGGLTLASAHIRIQDGGSITLGAGSNTTVTFPSDITGATTSGAPATIVNEGEITSFDSTLTLERIALDQGGAVTLDADSTIVTTHGSLRSRNGAGYTGPGRLVVSNGSSAILKRQQLLSDGFHLELGNDGTEGATLDGVATLVGEGSLDWTGGTIGAFLTLDPGVTFHVYGKRAGAGRRILSGHGSSHHTGQHDVICHGAVVVEDGAGFAMAAHALLTIASEGRLSLAPGTRVVGTSGDQGDAIRVSDTTISVPADTRGPGDVVLHNVEYDVAGGQIDVAPGSALTLTGDARGNLAQTGLTGGGTFAVAAPMDVVSVFSFDDSSLMRLLPGGSLNGTAVYTGDGEFAWLGGELSGNDIAFGLNDLTVGGGTTKRIYDDAGSTSFVQVVNPVTFTPGSKQHPNLVDMNGNAFETFVGCTVRQNVRFQDGIVASSDGALMIAPRRHGTVVTDSDVQLFTSGPFTLSGGTLVSRGAFQLNGGEMEIRADTTLRLPDPNHPLTMVAGSLSGAGVVDGDIVNSSGVFDPLASGAGQPIAVHGSYTQSGGGRLVLDLSADAAPYAFDGTVAVAGDVTYRDLKGYSPSFGDERAPVTSGAGLSWTPTCEETTGTRSGHGHWAGAAVGQDLLATFEKGASGSCDD